MSASTTTTSIESVLIHSGNVWRVCGDLSFRHAARLARQARTIWNDGGPPARIELGDVRQADSAGLALLLQWRGWRQNDGPVLSNIPEQIRVLAELHGVNSLLTSSMPATKLANPTNEADHHG